MYDKINSVLRSIYALISTLLAWATEEHTQELKNTIIQKLDMVSAHVSELIDEKIELDVVPKIFHAYLYLPYEVGGITDHETTWTDQARLKGKRLGIEFKDEQPVIRVLFLNTEDPEKSWQDHGVPKALCEALGIERSVFAPNYLPLEMIENLHEGDTLVLEPKDGIQIHLYVCQKIDKTNDETFETALTDVCRKTFRNINAMAHRPGGSNHIEKYYLALCYLFGFGTPQNEDAANEWLHVAAADGNHRAQVRLGE